MIFCDIFINAGELVSGIQCLHYTSDFIRNESISRTEGNMNFRKFSFTPKYTPEVMRLAVTLARSSKLLSIRPTKIKKQFIISKNEEKLSDDAAISMINNSNLNTFSSWEDRQRYCKNYMIISPIMNDRFFSISKYSCTCRTYLNTYECEHSLGISIARNEISDTISMNLPLGLKRKRGRPNNAVKGALNRQTKETRKNRNDDAVTNEISNSANNVLELPSQERGKEQISFFLYFTLIVNLLTI